MESGISSGGQGLRRGTWIVPGAYGVRDSESSIGVPILMIEAGITKTSNED